MTPAEFFEPILRSYRNITGALDPDLIHDAATDVGCNGIDPGTADAATPWRANVIQPWGTGIVAAKNRLTVTMTSTREI